MDIECTNNELTIFKTIAEAAEELSMPVYIIGGFVRDKIMHRPTNDADIVCVGDGIQLAKKTAQKFNPKPQVNIFKTFGTAQIKIPLNNNEPHPNPFLKEREMEYNTFHIEIVSARTESYNYDSRKPEVQAGTLDEDRLRRDFTINTISLSLNKKDFGKLIDPLGGMGDIEAQLLKTPLTPDATFSDDPLRMMRAVRFASQLKFTIFAETFEAIKRNAHRIKIVSAERVTDELNKIILTEKPSTGFDLLYKSGLLNIVFPQMVALAGAEYIDGKGHKDNFYHTLQVLDNISQNTNDLWLRWAAILHDIAKPLTKRFEEGHGWTFHGHEVVGGRMVPKIFAQMKLPLNERMKYVRRIVELHLRPISLTSENITDSAIRRLLFDAGDDIDDLMTLCKADITSKNKQKVQRFLFNFDLVSQRLKEVEETDRIKNWQPPITGEIIMKEFGLPPSRIVGDIKKAVREAMLDGIIPNDYDAAYSFMVEKANELGITKKN